MAKRIRTIKQATAVAARGAEAIPELLSAPGLRVPERVAAVRALGLIGGDAALDALAGYRDDAHPKVIAELLRAARSYPPEDFGPAVLADGAIAQLDVQADANLLALIPHMTGLTRLRLSKTGPHLTVLSALGSLPALQELSLQGASQLRSLDGLSALPALQRLYVLDAGALTSLDGLCSDHLQSLALQGAPLSDLGPLAALPALKKLSLTLAAATLDLSPLAALTALEQVSIRGAAVADLGPLAGLSALRVLSVRLAPSVAALPPASLPALWRLHIEGCVGLTDLAPFLGGAPALLECILLDAASLRDLDALRGAQRLCNLTVTGAPHLSDLSGIAGLERLRDLKLSRAGALDLAPLSQAVGLRRLMLEACSPGDVRPLAGLPQLEQLGLRECGLRDVSALAGLSGLRQLDISHNPGLTDVSPLGALPALEEVVMYSTAASRQDLPERLEVRGGR